MEIVQSKKVSKFIRGLDDVLVSRIDASISSLGNYGHMLTMPASKPLGKGLFELRIMGSNHVRIFYCFRHNKAYLLNIIHKKSRALAQKDIELARFIMNQI